MPTEALATPTEAAAVGSAGALVIGFAFGALTLRGVADAAVDSVKMSAAILFIVFAAFIFSYAVETTGIAQAFSAWLLFAKAVKECGSEVTRKCVYEHALNTTDWTGGGLHAPQDVENQKPGICGIMIEATADGFTTARGFEPNEGLLACDDENVITLTGDYGQGATLESVGKSLDDLE